MIDRLEEEVDVLDRHLQVLKTVIANEPIGIVKLSRELGYQHHKVRYSLRILEDADLIEPTKQGAVTTDHAADFVETFNDELTASVDRLDAMRIDAIEISQ
jgi:predicted transcriptional regulator